MTSLIRRTTILITLLGLAGLCLADEDLMQAAKVLYPYHRGSLVLDCTLCHTGQEGGGLNDYGKDVLEAGAERASLQRIDWRDSDGDGVVNVDELRVDSHPSGGEDFPTPEELEDVRAAEWPVEMVTYPDLLVDVSRVRPTSRVLTDREIQRVERALDRTLTRYERQPFFVVAKADVRGTMRDDLAGAVYVIDLVGPSGPMQVAVFLMPNRVVAGVVVMRHNEAGPMPAEESEAAGEESEDSDVDEDEAGAPEPIVLPGGLMVRPPRPMTFTSEEALDAFKRWSLDNEGEWDETVRQLQEWDPDHREVYPRIADAVATALWLAEETMPRPVFQGGVGAPKRIVD